MRMKRSAVLWNTDDRIYAAGQSLRRDRTKNRTFNIVGADHSGGEFEIKIMNTGKTVHNPEEYVTGLLEAEAMQDEG